MDGRHLKYFSPKNFLEKQSGQLIDDKSDLEKAIASLRDAFQKADGKTILAEVWTPVVAARPDVPVKLKPAKREVNRAKERQGV